MTSIGRFAFRGIAIVLIGTAGFSGPAPAKTAPAPMHSGGRSIVDGCPGFGVEMATVLPMKPGAYLSVRQAPNIRAKEMDRLNSGHPVAICTNRVNGQWVGVIYRVQGQDGGEDLWDCGLAEARYRRGPYGASCRSGWVSRRYLLNSAG